MTKTYPESELLLKPGNRIYHLHLHEDDLADTVITVGDPERVPAVSKHFDSIDCEIHQREFITHTGYIGKKRLSVVSTGIGTDNIDIVLTELDALKNIDFDTREDKPTFTPLNIIRIGTCGGLQQDLPVDSFVASQSAIGLDGLMAFYNWEENPDEEKLLQGFIKAFPTLAKDIKPYHVSGSNRLLEQFNDIVQGITVTCTGFYGPQGRGLRAAPRFSTILEDFHDFNYEDNVITNFEMETAGIYSLARLLNHQALSLSAVVANRATQSYSQKARETVDKLIEYTLEKLVS